MTLLGTEIDGKQKIPIEVRKQSIIMQDTPKNVTELRSFLGKINAIREYIPRVAELTQKLTGKTSSQNTKNFVWTRELNEEF